MKPVVKYTMHRENVMISYNVPYVIYYTFLLDFHRKLMVGEHNI
jgi:hypothetical protein